MVTCASAPLRERVLVVLSYNDGPNRLVLSILDRLARTVPSGSGGKCAWCGTEDKSGYV